MSEEAKSIVDISGGEINVSGDLIGGNKIVNVIQPPEPIQSALAARFQLPPPPADFTGREAELRDLRAAIEKGGVNISGLQGQGGVGKTVLALSLAAELAPKHPDAQIYLDLKGVSQGPLTVAEVLAYVVRTFHPEAKLPEKEDELRPLFINALHDKRVLLLMDNAKDGAQVKSLIPPEGCTLLVTSRYRFTLPGLHQKILDTFPQEDATKLLLRIAPRIDDEAEAIAKLCGHLPLALRLAASVIAVRMDIEPSDYRRQLAEEKKRLKLLATDDESVEACINLSYKLLDAQTQKSWRMLSVFPDTFDPPAATAVWEIEQLVPHYPSNCTSLLRYEQSSGSSDAAKETLSRLLQFSMLEWNDSSKRYRLHDLMRDFARERWTATEADGTARRHAWHYGTLLGTADGLYVKGGESVMRGLALLDLEWGNVRTGQAWAAAHAPESNEAARLCSGYPDCGANILGLRQHPQEEIRWREPALTSARQLKDRAAEGRHLGSLGSAYSQLCDYRRAIDYFQLDLAISREMHDRRSEGQTLGNLGRVYFALADYRRAIEHYDRALAIAHEFDDRRVESNQLNHLAIAYSSLGNFQSAIEHYEKALAIAREIGDHRKEGLVLGGLGNLYKDVGENLRAIGYYEQQLAIALELCDRQSEGLALGNMGLAYHALRDFPRAIALHEKRLAIARERDDRLGEGQALGNLGIAYKELGDFPRALDYHKQDLAIVLEIGDRRGEGFALWNISRVLYSLGDRRKAIEHAEAALRIKEEIGDPTAARVRKQLEEWRRA